MLEMLVVNNGHGAEWLFNDKNKVTVSAKKK